MKLSLSIYLFIYMAQARTNTFYCQNRESTHTYTQNRDFYIHILQI